MTDAGAGVDTKVPLLRGFQQGDVLDGLTEVCVLTASGWDPINVSDGVALISQTCDIVQETRAYVQVAKLVPLRESDASLARSGRRPRYAHLPEFGTDWFADLEVIATVHKSVIAPLSPKRGVATDMAIRKFSAAVARKFGRFAFPDEVTPWLSNLEKFIRTGVGKQNSAFAEVMRDVLELRIESIGGWGDPPYELKLLVVVEPGVMPVYADGDEPDLPPQLDSWLFPDAGVVRKPKEIADRIRTINDPAERYFLWDAFASALAGLCQPPADASPEVRAAVLGGEIVAEPISTDELTYARYRRTEILDVDDLC
ncbi:hypothetical protein ABZ412_34290 [Nocardia sp. NPDC005746]|uniref:hypothetical protein n=1 Tax=Nocardia sp. NPDC005746 TaxID=3157062 RepID=UPI0033D4964B